MSVHVTAWLRYGGIVLFFAIGAVVVGVPSTFHTPLSGQFCPVLALVPKGARILVGPPNLFCDRPWVRRPVDQFGNTRPVSCARSSQHRKTGKIYLRLTRSAQWFTRRAKRILSPDWVNEVTRLAYDERSVSDDQWSNACSHGVVFLQFRGAPHVW